MTEPVRPVTRVERPSGERREGERRAAAQARGRELVPVEAPAEEPAPAPAAVSAGPPPPSPTAFAAQVLGQEGQKRGLRGGKEVLDQARSTYLSAEYSGPADRRPPKGKATRSEV